ncbi:Uncharacterized [Syntrophomonas zehnderi OL-4]|uniref:Uncharacterized n=1 Tax=Syntrophomonas zehnderi OL-4 TaxID=690567 RepID=A0A0E4GDD1_9FIRM|nr:hypothetical protein [Syntrophomonas zehnderi]CFX43836.1 Uncharacterized [Syntrophomonas zehnderi OL-4]
MTNTGLGAAPQPDPQAMEALMAKVARIQKILGFLSQSQGLVGLILLFSPFWLSSLTGMQEPFAFLALAPFFLGLAYAANFAKKDLTFAKVVFRNTAIAQTGLFIIALIGIFFLKLPVVFWVLAAITFILGGLPGMVIYQAQKEQK